MAQIASQRQGFLGKGNKGIEIVAVAFIAIAVALAVWAAFAAAPKVAAPAKTSIGYLQEPGLLAQRAGERQYNVTTSGSTLLTRDMQVQRAGERGVDLARPGSSILSRDMQLHRKGEREVVVVQTTGKWLTPQMEERKMREQALREQALKDAKIHRHLRGHSAGRS
jgi:hypothetical protein